MSLVRNFVKTIAAEAAIAVAVLPALAQSTCPFSQQEGTCHSVQSDTSVHVASVRDNQDLVDTAVSAGRFKTLIAAIKAADLVDVLKGEGPFTVFAPSDEAFAKLPDGIVEDLLKPENKAKLVQILTYHVVPGRVDAASVARLTSAPSVAGPSIAIAAKENNVLVDNAQVVMTDIACSNGVIHVIDTVIMPRDIVDTAVAAGSFKTLVSAVKAAGLVETLKGSGPFTVFAPSDEAFAKLPKETLDALLKPENKAKLIAILTYHVVPGKVLASDVIKIDSAKTVNGQPIKIATQDNCVMINGAKVLKTDVVGANGVIHVIDSVLLPK